MRRSRRRNCSRDVALTHFPRVAGAELSGLSDEAKHVVRERKLTPEPYAQRLTYSYWPAEHVLKVRSGPTLRRAAEPDAVHLRTAVEALLPSGMDVPASFETVGHIAHLNLRDELLPHKYVIGRVLLDKNTRIRTVLNKVRRLLPPWCLTQLRNTRQVGTIESEFRVPSFEVIAGDTCLEARPKHLCARRSAHSHPPLHRPRCVSTVQSSDSTMARCTGTPGWSTSTSGAQGSPFCLACASPQGNTFRLADLFCPGEVVVDLMAGIGPFAIPAARRRVTVHANDLNPQCAHYLRINVRANKVGRTA